MQDYPNTALILLAYNSLAELEKFLPALVSDCPSWAKIYIIDNASTDGSKEFVENQYKEITWIQNPENWGYAKGYDVPIRINKEIEEDFIVLLNTDVYVKENWLEPLITRLTTEKKLVAVQPKIKSYNNPEYFEHAGASGGFIDWLGYPFCRGRIFDTLEKDEGQYDTAIDCFWASGACLAMKKDAYIEAGGFDHQFFMHMEEIDLCWRFHRLGYRVMVEPKSVVYHVGGGSLNYSNPKKTCYNFRNNLSLLLKNQSMEKALFALLIRVHLDWIAAFREFLQFKFRHTFAIGTAWLSFLYRIFTWRKNQNLSKRYLSNKNIYSKSIIVNYFIQKKKKYSSL